MRCLNRGWINAYVNDYIIKQESPKQFHFWVAASVIAGTLRRNVWVDRGAYKLYPNMFIFLVTESGACRKGAAMRAGLSFLREVKDVTIMYERMSLEGLLVRMDKCIRTKDGRTVPDGSIFIVADELSDLFGKSSFVLDLTSALTSLYTCMARFEHATRNKGLVQVKNPTPCILAGTTPEQFGDIFPGLVKFSGFLGRTVLVTGRREQRVPKAEYNVRMQQDLYDDLMSISDLRGEIKLTKDAEKWFEDWYMALPDFPEHSLPAFHERKHDHLLKLSMVLSVAESDDMIIHRDHLETALVFLEIAEDGIDSAIQYIGASGEFGVADKIMKGIKSKGGEAFHSDIMRMVYRYVRNAQEFNGIVEMLIHAGLIVQGKHKNSMVYKVTPLGWNLGRVRDSNAFLKASWKGGKRGKKKK